MNKKFIMAALAGFLTVCGLAVTAEGAAISSKTMTAKDSMKILVIAKPEYNLAEKLTNAQPSVDGKTMGYLVNPGTSAAKFVSLAEAMPTVEVTKDPNGDDIAALGHFTKGDNIQFGYNSAQGFSPAPISVLSSDSGYYAGYNSDSFYQLDFSEMPFDGKVDILVIGEPLPSSTVTLLVSLGALVIFLGYVRRKQQHAHAVQES